MSGYFTGRWGYRIPDKSELGNFYVKQRDWEVSSGSKQPDAPHEDAESEYSSSSEDVTEDEDGTELTPALDAAILRTLRKIRRKEGAIYGKENVLEEAMKEAEAEAAKKGITARNATTRKTEKPFLLADHHRKALLSGDHKKSEFDDEEDRYYGGNDDGEPLTHVQSQYELRREAVEAFKAFAGDEEGDADDEEGEEGFAPVKRDGPGDDNEEDEEYRKFLVEMGGGEDEVRKMLAGGSVSIGQSPEIGDVEVAGEAAAEIVIDGGEKKKEKKRRKKKQDDDFLMNYILNRGWIDKSADHNPTYDEIVGQDTESNANPDGEAVPSTAHPWGTLAEDDDDFEDKADAFEAAYNFRFEEPNSTDILTHPRSIPSLVRRPDDTRATKRAKRAERKAAEKEAKEEAIRAEKGKKRRELEKRLNALREDLGDGLDWEEVEKLMEGDYDEREWDDVMGKMISQMADKEDDEDDDGKPIWDEDIGDAEYDEMEVEEGDDEGREQYGQEDPIEENYQDDGPINMDADHMEEPSKKKRKKNKKGKSKDQPDDGPSEPLEPQEDLTITQKAAKVKSAIKEYQKLDHEDMIGDLSTRFKYTKAPSTDFGLTPVEILLATDGELNNLISVKHIAPYRYNQSLGAAGKGLGKKVRELKESLKKRKWGEEYVPEKEERIVRHRDNGYVSRGGGEGSSGDGVRKGKRLGKKERMKMKIVADGSEGVVSPDKGDGTNAGESSRSAKDVGEKRKVEVPSPGEKVPGGEVAHGDGEGKKRRKKKKHSQVNGGV